MGSHVMTNEDGSEELLALNAVEEVFPTDLTELYQNLGGSGLSENGRNQLTEDQRNRFAEPLAALRQTICRRIAAFALLPFADR